MLENIPKIIQLISKRFPRSIRLQKKPRSTDGDPIAHFFRTSHDSLNLLTLHIDYSRETWSVVEYECPSENEFEEFLNTWTKWGLFTNVLYWRHEEVNLME